MACHDWVEEFPGAVTVCDGQGIIVEMNDQAARVFGKDGGKALIGTNLLDCHPEPARTMLREIMAARRVHTYTTEKNGIRKLIYQAPWHRNGQYCGFVEVALEIPPQMPHFIRS
jgi:PAS domain S-box-containing protein